MATSSSSQVSQVLQGDADEIQLMGHSYGTLSGSDNSISDVEILQNVAQVECNDSSDGDVRASGEKSGVLDALLLKSLKDIKDIFIKGYFGIYYCDIVCIW